MRKLDPRINHIGESTTTPGLIDGKPSWRAEGSRFMNGVNNVPGMNAMGYGHDILATDYKMSPFVNKATIAPAIVATYAALGANKDQAVTKAATEEDKKDKR